MLLRKEALLALLSDGAYHSGEALGQALGISRAAVWKWVAQLRAQGVMIEAGGKRGYRLASPADTLAMPLLTQGLSLAFAGCAVHTYATVDSTNRVLAKLALEGAPHGTLVLAEEQTAGRGRRGRTWESPPGTSVMLSLLLRPPLHPAGAQGLTMLAALAMAQACTQACGEPVRIKWPNDLVLRGKKVCGMLLEMNATQEELAYVVMGIGVNVSQRAEDFAPELCDRAASLAMQCGRPVRRGDVVRAFLPAVEALYAAFLAHGAAALLPAYRAQCATLGARVRVEAPGETFEGTAEDVDADGALLVRTDDGGLRRLLAGDVSVRGMMGYV